MFNEIRQLSQTVIQNGGSLYDIIELYSTNSVRQMKKIFKDLKEKQDTIQQQQMHQKQQEIDQQRYTTDAQIQQAQRQHEEQIAHDDYQKEMDRISKEKIATIKAESIEKVPLDVNQDSIPDILENSRLMHEQTKAANDYRLKTIDIQSKNNIAMEKLKVEREKLDNERKNHKDDIEIAKINARGRNKSK
jgi:hypothetical protein